MPIKQRVRGILALSNLLVISFDFCHAKDFEEAKSHLDLSTKFIADASHEWMVRARQGDIDPQNIDQKFSAYVTNLYAAHNGTIC